MIKTLDDLMCQLHVDQGRQVNGSVLQTYTCLNTTGQNKTLKNGKKKRKHVVAPLDPNPIETHIFITLCYWKMCILLTLLCQTPVIQSTCYSIPGVRVTDKILQLIYSKNLTIIFGDGAFSLLWGFRGKVWWFVPSMHFVSMRRLAHTHWFNSLCQDQSTVAQWAETTMTKCSLTSCVWACFPDRFPHYAWTAESAHSTSRVKDVCTLKCNLPPALLAKWLGSFTCHCSNTGWIGHQVRVSTES